MRFKLAACLPAKRLLASARAAACPHADHRIRLDSRLFFSSADSSAGDVPPRPVEARKKSALLATEEELAVLMEAKEELWRIEQRPPLLPHDEQLLDVQLIRFLREHGPDASKIAGCYRRALEWRQKMLPDVPETEDPLAWMSASEMVRRRHRDASAQGHIPRRSLLEAALTRGVC